MPRIQPMTALALPGVAPPMIRTWSASPCLRYRYTLERIWDRSLPTLVSVGLNPSRADDMVDDSTIRKDIGFARRWGCGRVVKLNIFAWRDTDPKAMKKAVEPIGEGNDRAILDACISPAVWRVVVSWGAHGSHLGRGEAVAKLLSGAGVEMWALGVNANGSPEHELYVPYERELRRWA